MGVISDLIPDIDSILGVRDDLGAALKVINIVTRTWSGSAAGDGTMTETRVQVLPSPRVTQYKKNLALREGGGVEAADVQLRMISKNKYSETDLNFKDVPPNVEKFFEMGGELYRPIGVEEKHVCWNVMTRRISNQ